MLEGSSQGVGEGPAVGDLDDPDRGAEMGGLDEQGQSDLRDLARAPLRLAAPALGGDPDVLDLRQPLCRHDLLEEDLVQAQRRGRDAGADIRDDERLEQALDGAVLAERAVQHGEDDLRSREALAGGQADRLALGTPDAVAADLDPEDLVPAGLQAVSHRGRRGQRDLVLGGAPACQHRDVQRGARCSSSGRD